MQIGTEARRQSGTPPSPDSIDMTRTALLLDVDGTLLDIASMPTGVVVPPTLRTTLRDLLQQSGGGVAFVSGRTIATLDHIFAPLKPPAIGGHGAEIRLSARGPALHPRPAALSETLRRQLQLIAEIDPHLLLEDKLHSIALHYRLAFQQEAFLRKEIAAMVSREPVDTVEILFGKAVIEIKPKLFSKGLAVCELMTYEPFAGRTPLFIGDDTTDESVFRILPELSGLGYSVGRAMAGVHGIFRSPEHVRSWLALVSAHNRRAP
jgi:trehalose 6-phosphate phosphatase